MKKRFALSAVSQHVFYFRCGFYVRREAGAAATDNARIFNSIYVIQSESFL